MNKFRRILLIIIPLILAFTSCKTKDNKPPYQLDNQKSDVISIKYEEMGGVKVIPVKINGITLSMIFDTGCSGIHMSLNELSLLAKNGVFTEDDIIGSQYSSIADGSIVENGVINIKEIVIGDSENGIVLRNKEASVSNNLTAPILLGNEVLDELATIEVDNINKTINFYKK